MITFLIFCHWKKGSQKWVKIAPTLFTVVVILNYLIIPIANTLMIAIILIETGEYIGYLKSYFIFFAVLFSNRILEFLFRIRVYVLQDAK